MKVLHLLNAYLAPTENWIYQLIRSLPGVRNYIGAVAFLPNEFLSDPDFVYLRDISGDKEALAATLPVLNPKHTLQKIGLKIWLLRHGGYEAFLWKTFRHDKPDVVHAHFAPRGWRYRRLAKKLGVPYVVSFYGYDYERFPFERPEYRKRYLRLFKLADKFLCEGAHGAKILAGMGCPAHKIAIVRLGVDTDRIPFFKREKKKIRFG